MRERGNFPKQSANPDETMATSGQVYELLIIAASDAEISELPRPQDRDVDKVCSDILKGYWPPSPERLIF